MLVTRGAAFIGSVTVEQLIKAGNDVAIFDNLSQGHLASVHQEAHLIEGDLANATVINATVINATVINATVINATVISTYTDGVIADNVIEQLRQKDNRPFCLAVGFKKPHQYPWGDGKDPSEA